MARRYNKETEKAAKRIRAFLAPNGETHVVTGVLRGSLFRVIVGGTHLRWIFGSGWVETGTGNGSRNKEAWMPIIGKPEYTND